MSKSPRRAYARPALWRRALRLFWRVLRILVVSVAVLGPAPPPPPLPRLPVAELRVHDEDDDE